LEKVDILGVLMDDKNQILILESIKEYHRNILIQNKEAEEQQEQERRQHHWHEYENEDNNNSEQTIQYESVSTTLRRHEGTAYTKGTITGISSVSKAISKISFYCNYCKRLVEIDLPYSIVHKIDIEKQCDK